jgi:hypothetical protein
MQRIPAGFLILMGLVLAGACLPIMLRGGTDGGGSPSRPWMALGFGFMGLMMLVVGVRIYNEMRREKFLKTLFVGEPWRWRDDWSEGVVRFSPMREVIVLALFAAFWNTIAWTIAIGVFTGGPTSRSTWWIALLFPATGIVLAIAAGISGLRAMHWGMSILRLDAFPPRLDAELAGVVELTRPLQSAEPVQVQLQCTRVAMERRGDSRIARRTQLWADSYVLDPTELLERGLQIPIDFVIPADQWPVSENEPRIAWTLEVSTRHSRPAYKAVFELPVANADPNAPPATPRRPDRQRASRSLAVDDPSIVVTPMAGALKVDFPRGRHKGIALFLIAFAIVFIGVSVGFAMRGFGSWVDFVHVGLPITFGLIGLLMLFLAIDLLVTRSSITVRRGMVELDRHRLVGAQTIHIAGDDISSLSLRSTATMGNATYYDLELMTITGKKHTLGLLIKGRTAAQGLLDQIEAALGRDETRST